MTPIRILSPELRLLNAAMGCSLIIPSPSTCWFYPSKINIAYSLIPCLAPPCCVWQCFTSVSLCLQSIPSSLFFPMVVFSKSWIWQGFSLLVSTTCIASTRTQVQSPSTMNKYIHTYVHTGCTFVFVASQKARTHWQCPLSYSLRSGVLTPA